MVDYEVTLPARHMKGLESSQIFFIW